MVDSSGQIVDEVARTEKRAEIAISGCGTVEPAAPQPEIHAGIKASYRKLGDWSVRVQNHPSDTRYSGYGPTITISASIHTSGPDSTLNTFTMQLPLDVGFAVGDVLSELRDKLADS